MINSKERDLTTGSVLNNLVSFVIPFLFASFMQSFYSAVDMWAVGQFSSSADLASVNTGTQVTHIVSGCIIGISMGSTVLTGHAVGAKDGRSAALAVGNSMLLFLGLAALLTPAMYFSAGPVAELMRTPVEAVQGAADYIRICGCGVPFIIAYNVTSAILRGDGNSTMPMVFVGIACIVNVAGDILLTGFLGMGVTGVAISTVVAQLTASLVGIMYIIKKGFSFNIEKTAFKPDLRVIRRIVGIGLPIALQDMLISCSFIAITVVANLRGVTDASAVGVDEKIISLMFLFPFAMMSALTAITSQNTGAGKSERAVLSLKYGMLITAVFGAIFCALSWLIPETLTSAFTTDHGVIVSAGQYLRTYSIDCICVSFTFCVNGYLCGTDRSIVVFVHNLISVTMVRIPLAIILSAMFPTTMLPMGMASTMGSVVSIIIISAYFLISRRRKKISL